jgi:hephaestin
VLSAGGLGGNASAQRQTSRAAVSEVTRTYYIAADEVDWNFAPSDHDHMTGKPYDERARLYIDNGPDRIGRIYRKAVYHEYTDASFKTEKPRPASWQHLGVLSR